ncbi:MAG: hypothetical protein PWP03_215 [Candidatus Woesearchaeota archaeon]|nr:hypothetical protein [Candidatus Woesearchaeota archaeon]
MKKKLVSIIVPVYNEEKTVGKVINSLLELKPDNFNTEIIIINDGSTDNTKKAIFKFKDRRNIKIIEHKENQGKGAAVRDGIKVSKGDIIIIQDADLEYEPQEIIKCINPILQGKAKVVYGSRFLSKDNVKRIIDHGSIIFYLGNKIVTFFTNLCFNTRLTDEATCYKTFESSIIKSIKIESSGFEWEPEVTAKILKQGIKIKEVPIKYNPRIKGKKIKYRDGIKAILTILKYKFFYP